MKAPIQLNHGEQHVKSMTPLTVAAVGTGVIGLLAVAQMSTTEQGMMPGMEHSAMAAASDATSAGAHQQAMDVMVKEMMMKFSRAASSLIVRAPTTRQRSCCNTARPLKSANSPKT